MKYEELIKYFYDYAKEHVKFKASDKELRQLAVLTTNAATKYDESDAQLMDIGICPKCYQPDYLLRVSDDTTICLECGEKFTEIID